MRPLAWGDSFGFRQVITRSRDVSEPGQLAGLKIRTIQSPIYVKAVELMGASPTPMAFGEVYTSLQTGVIDGYEHDASTTLQQRFYEVARLHGAHAAHRRRPRAVCVDRRAWRGFPPDLRTALERAALDAATATARHGTARGHRARPAQLAAHGMTIRDIDGSSLPAARRAAVGERGARARRRVVARGDPRVTTVTAEPPVIAPRRGPRAPVVYRHSRCRRRRPSWACRSSAATCCDSPFPWTEEIARLLLVWLMCVGGISALRHGQHPRVTALVRLFSAARRAAIDRGLRLVLLGFLLLPRRPGVATDCRERGRTAAGERALRRDDLRRAAGRPAHDVGGAPAAVPRDGTGVWRDRDIARLVRGAAGLAIASVLVPLVAGASPLVVLVTGFLVTAALGMPLAFTLALTSLTYLLGHRRRQPDHPADQDSRRRRLLRAARDSAVHRRRCPDGVRRHLGAHRGSRDGDRRARARRSRDGGGRRRGSLLRHFGIDRG